MSPSVLKAPPRRCRTRPLHRDIRDHSDRDQQTRPPKHAASRQERHGRRDCGGTCCVIRRSRQHPEDCHRKVPCIRLLRVARRSAIHARTQAVNQFQNIVDTAPDELCAELSESRGPSRFANAAPFHTPSSMSPRAAARSHYARLPDVGSPSTRRSTPSTCICWRPDCVSGGGLVSAVLFGDRWLVSRMHCWSPLETTRNVFGTKHPRAERTGTA